MKTAQNSKLEIPKIDKITKEEVIFQRLKSFVVTYVDEVLEERLDSRGANLSSNSFASLFRKDNGTSTSQGYQHEENMNYNRQPENNNFNRKRKLPPDFDGHLVSFLYKICKPNFVGGWTRKVPIYC